MNKNNMILNLLIIGLLIALFSACGILYKRNNTSKNIESKDEIHKGEKKLQDNPYADLRNMAFSTTPEELQLQINDSHVVVYGCVVDWSSGLNVVTIVTFKTGDVSMYLRSGQIYIGGFSHENLRKAGQNLILEASSKISETKLTTNFTLPVKDIVNIYLITNKGIYTARESYKNLKNHHSKWGELFGFVNEIIFGYRQTEK